MEPNENETENENDLSFSQPSVDKGVTWPWPLHCLASGRDTRIMHKQTETTYLGGVLAHKPC